MTQEWLDHPLSMRTQLASPELQTRSRLHPLVPSHPDFQEPEDQSSDIPISFRLLFPLQGKSSGRLRVCGRSPANDGYLQRLAQYIVVGNRFRADQNQKVAALSILHRVHAERRRVQHYID